MGADDSVRYRQPFPCRTCGRLLEAGFNATPGRVLNTVPSDRAFSLCAYCGELTIFVIENGEVSASREPNFVELEIFNRKYGHLARACADFRAQRPPPRAHP